LAQQLNRERMSSFAGLEPEHSGREVPPARVVGLSVTGVVIWFKRRGGLFLAQGFRLQGKTFYEFFR